MTIPLAVKSALAAATNTAPKKYLRNLLSRRLEQIEDRLYANAAVNGYGDITPAMARFYGHLAGRPIHMSELARKLSVSRQAVHKMALEGVRGGYIEVVPCDQSGRQKIIRFTDKGRTMSESATQELEAIEAALVQHLGQSNLDKLKDLLQIPWREEDKHKV